MKSTNPKSEDLHSVTEFYTVTPRWALRQPKSSPTKIPLGGSPAETKSSPEADSKTLTQKKNKKMRTRWDPTILNSFLTDRTDSAGALFRTRRASFSIFVAS